MLRFSQLAAHSIGLFALLIVGGCQVKMPSSTGVSREGLVTLSTVIPQCALTVVNGYPTSYVCNALAQAVQETMSCEVESMDKLAQLHGIVPGLPADQITWWCQNEMASSMILDCTPSATNPCDQVHVYNVVAMFNKAKAIQTALAQNLVEPVEIAPDGQYCPNGSSGLIGGVTDMDGFDGPFVNWVMSQANVVNYNTFGDGDFNNINGRVPYYKGVCTRPPTHSMMFAQAALHRNQLGLPSAGCAAMLDPFALDVNGNPNLDMQNKFNADTGCPILPTAAASLEQQRGECLGIIADEQRITLDGPGGLGLFPGAFVFVQLRRQYAAFAALNCNALYGLVDLNADLCPVTCVKTPCGQNGCVGVCGTCPASNMMCSTNGQCVPACTPKCTGRMCGPDACGGTCGVCGAGTSCDVAGKCEPNATTPVSLSQQVVPFLNARCSGCHSTFNNGTSVLDFQFLNNVFQNIVNVKSKSCPGRTLIVPGDAAHSYLIDKVEGKLGLCAGGSMHYGTTDAELQNLVNWVNQGALNN